MADVTLIKPSELTAASAVNTDAALVIDNSGAVLKATPAQVVNAGAPASSEAQALAGTDNTTRMTPLRVRQALDNTAAPAVLRAQAWAESSSAPDPLIPSSQSAKTWAEASENSADLAFGYAQDADAAAGAIKVFASRSEFLSANIPASLNRVGWFAAPSSATNPSPIYVVRANSGPISQANGSKWAPDGDVFADHFGSNDTPGTTDMTTAIQAAVNYCVSTRAVLNFMPNEYRTAKITVSGRIEMWGGGQDATIIRTITGSTFTSLLEVASGSFIVSIYDMQWNGMARADRTIEFVDYPGSDAPYHKSLIMERCKVYGGIESQIRFGKRRYLAWVSNSEIYGGKAVIEFDGGADHRFIQCDFGGPSEKIVTASDTRACVFTACHFYGSGGDGIVLSDDCYRWVFNGGSVDTNQGDGFVWAGEGHIVSSVKFAGNALGSTTKSDISYSGSNGILANCMFVLGSGATAPQYNIRVGVAAGNLYESGVVFQSGAYSVAPSNDNRAAGWNNQNMRGGLTSLARLDGNGRRIYDTTGQASPLSLSTASVGVGYPAALDGLLHIATASGATSEIIDSHTAGQSGDPAVIFRSGRGTVAAKLPAQSGDISGRLDYRAYDGSAYQNTARAKSEVDGAVSAGVTPGRYVIMVANASGTLVEKLRIDSAGNFTLAGVPTSNPGGSGRLWNDAGTLKIT